MVSHYFQRGEVDGRFGEGVWGAFAEAGCCGVFVGVGCEELDVGGCEGGGWGCWREIGHIVEVVVSSSFPVCGIW